MNFDRITPFYDLIASFVFWGNIKESQVACLTKLPVEGDVLIIGGGTGWIIEHIFYSGKVRKLYYIEASKQMLERSRKSCSDQLKSQVEFIHGDEKSIPKIKYDAVITNFVLDCFDEHKLSVVMGTLFEQLKPGGMWYFTDFRIDQRWYRKFWQRPFLMIMFLFFRYSAQLESRHLFDFNVCFKKYDLTQIYQKYHFGGFIGSSINQKETFLSYNKYIIKHNILKQRIG